jgi:hypothetical protein
MQKRASSARWPVWLFAVTGVVLASTRIGPEMGAVSGAGCEGTILDGAGRVVVVAVETGAAENPRITVSSCSRGRVCR